MIIAHSDAYIPTIPATRGNSELFREGLQVVPIGGVCIRRWVTLPLVALEECECGSEVICLYHEQGSIRRTRYEFRQEVAECGVR